MVVPWIILTVMALIPWMPKGIELPTLVALVGIINSAGLASLAFRYWHVRAVRIHVAGVAGHIARPLRFAIRRRDVALATARLNGTDTHHTWRPVAW